MAGRVNEVDQEAAAVERRPLVVCNQLRTKLVVQRDARGLDGDAAVLLVLARVRQAHVSGSLDGDNAGSSNQRVGQRGFAVVHMRNHCHVANLVPAKRPSIRRRGASMPRHRQATRLGSLRASALVVHQLAQLLYAELQRKGRRHGHVSMLRPHRTRMRRLQRCAPSPWCREFVNQQQRHNAPAEASAPRRGRGADLALPRVLVASLASDACSESRSAQTARRCTAGVEQHSRAQSQRWAPTER